MSFASKFSKACAALGFALLPLPTVTFAQHYIQTNLASDGFISGPGILVDPDLSNPWGLTRSATGSPWWVGDNNTGVSSLYSFVNETVDSKGDVLMPPTLMKVSLSGGAVPHVTVPLPAKNPLGATASAPTGVVQNGSSDFVVGVVNGTNESADFIFCTEDGTVSGWNPVVSTSTAVLEVDNAPEAVYKGCTTGDVDGVRFLYVTNFRTARVEVYDTHFQPVHLGEEVFDDDRIPRGFAPFNIQNIGGSLFVTYAKQNSERHDDVAGDGLGFVDIFSTSGRLQARLEHGFWLNAPWGVVWAPRDFGEFSNRVLVGNFGNGQIAAFNGFDGHFIGFVENPDNSILTIDGLWSLTFGNSAAGCPAAPPAGSNLQKCGSAGPYNSLFFTAGPDGETHGLMGMLTAVPSEQDGDEE